MTSALPDPRKAPVRRFVRPAGFLIALLLFLLLPVAAASCSPEGDGTIEGSLSGAEVLTGSRPSLDADGDLVDFLVYKADSPMATTLDQARAGTAVRVVAGAVVVVLLLGIALELVRAPRVRAATAALIAVGAGVLVVVGERLIMAQWEPVLREAGLLTRNLPENEGRDAVVAALDTRHAGLGYWLALVTLAVIVIANAVLLFRPRASAVVTRRNPAR